MQKISTNCEKTLFRAHSCEKSLRHDPYAPSMPMPHRRDLPMRSELGSDSNIPCSLESHGLRQGAFSMGFLGDGMLVQSQPNQNPLDAVGSVMDIACAWSSISCLAEISFLPARNFKPSQ